MSEGEEEEQELGGHPEWLLQAGCMLVQELFVTTETQRLTS